MPEIRDFQSPAGGILSCGLTMMALLAIMGVMGVGGLTGRGR